ncbi:MAG: transporter related protein, partial [Solirubrobacteraceae bacterium]|nr:transporter related protein [Solirubrobacteraceae bacterium]
MEIIRFALLGLASGAIYAVLAQGLVLVYRGSGLLNFAQGAMAMVGAYVYYELSVRVDLPRSVGLLGAIVACGALGALIHLVILKPMHRSSPLSRVIATLGVLISLQSAAFIIYGQDPRPLQSLLPTRTVDVFSDELTIGLDRILIFAIGIVLTIVLTVVYRRTGFGRVTTAVAENHVTAASLGHSPDRTAVINWALGSALAGVAGVLIAPITFLEPGALTLLVLPAMAAALLGQFHSFSLALGMALAIGVAQSELTRSVTQPGWPTAAPFLAVIALLVLRGRALPLRSFVLDRLPKVSDGRIRPLPALVAVGIAVLAVAAADPTWALALTTTFAVAIICLSVVVITGYAGQLSLAQYVLAGVGALIAAKLAAHMSFAPALLLGAAATGVVGGLVGAPALRTRGIALAIVTLGLGASVFAVLLSNQTYTGGVTGITVPVPTLLGWDIDPYLHASRYAFVVLGTLVALCLMTMNLRRGAIGRRLLAVRSNERAAASLGVNVAVTKSYAFVLSAMMAATGGILLAFMQPSIIVAGFDVFSSIFVAAVTVAGGVGSVGGALIGSLLVQGGALSELLSSW